MTPTPPARPTPPSSPPLEEPAVAQRIASADSAEDLAEKSLPASAPKFLGYRRYQGTVNGRPVVVELQPKWVASPGYLTCESTYYYPASGVAYSLQLAYGWTTGQALEFTTPDQQFWCATQGLGPALSGTCSTRSGQLLGAFALHESYAGAVRYEILEETAPGCAGTDAFGEPDTASVTLQYVHLLGRDTLRPALARLQCPRPAQRQRAQRELAAELTPTPGDFAAVYQETKWVTLNEADLLSYHASLEESVMRKRHGEHSGQQVLLDLRTGREVDPLAQLRPGGLLALQRLLGRQALRDTAAAARQWLDKGLLDEPEEGFVITPAGWEAHYNTVVEDLPFSAYEAEVSWAELQPLLRADSPLQRIVRARGL
ncbi:MAG: hypothetical protein ACRYG7_39285 [Janthinobacterium lividum]